MYKTFEKEKQLFNDLQEALDDHPIDCESCLDGVIKAILFGVLACNLEENNYSKASITHLSTNLYGKQQ